MELIKLKCKYCSYLDFTLKALHDHCEDKHPAEFARLRVQLKDVEAKLRQLVEQDETG